LDAAALWAGLRRAQSATKCDAFFRFCTVRIADVTVTE
jgi:hypothetical protein